MGPPGGGPTRFACALALALALAPAAGADARPAGSSVAVPALVGSTWQVAERRLHALGLRAVTVRVVSGRPRGTVVAQHPRAHAIVARGTTVRLSVANLSIVNVPNVLGLQSVAAQDRLREVGLKPVVVSVHSLQEVGSVVAQHPAAGVDVVRGSSVSISVSGGPGP